MNEIIYTCNMTGHRGGLTTKKKHRKEFYSEIGRKGGSIPKELSEETLKKLSEAGRKGGLKTKEKHGIDYYREIGKKGGKKKQKIKTKEKNEENNEEYEATKNEQIDNDKRTKNE